MSAADRDPRTALVVDWVTRHVGPVASVDLQPRWRPHWFVEVDDGSEVGRVLVRSERIEDMTWPLEHEMRFQRVLHEHGILVPKVHGWIDELPAMVTDAPIGRPDFADSTDAERDVVVDEYLQALAAMHSLDIAPLVKAGIDRAARPEESGLVGLQRMEALYRRHKRHPNPFLEWVLGWVRRHPPQSRGRESPVVWDSGQLLHDKGHLVAVIDLEIGHLGDPMMDLAAWRLRDSVIPFGDFNQLYARYGELVGTPVDLDAIHLHLIGFSVTGELGFRNALRDPPPGSDFATNMQWCNENNLWATESIAEYLDVELPTVEPIEDGSSKVHVAHEHLVRSLRTMQNLTDDAFLRHQIRISFRMARHLMRFDEIGDAAVAADLDDLHGLLGRRPASWEEGEEELERFVLADVTEGRHDEALLSVLHRRNLRAQMLNGPAGSAMARHMPIQRLRDSRSTSPT
jgi:hypothetical protein